MRPPPASIPPKLSSDASEDSFDSETMRSCLVALKAELSQTSSKDDISLEAREDSLAGGKQEEPRYNDTWKRCMLALREKLKDATVDEIMGQEQDWPPTGVTIIMDVESEDAYVKDTLKTEKEQEARKDEWSDEAEAMTSEKQRGEEETRREKHEQCPRGQDRCSFNEATGPIEESEETAEDDFESFLSAVRSELKQATSIEAIKRTESFIDMEGEPKESGEFLDDARDSEECQGSTEAAAQETRLLEEQLDSTSKAMEENQARLELIANRWTKAKDDLQIESLIKSELEKARAELETAQCEKIILECQLADTSNSEAQVKLELKRAREKFEAAEKRTRLLESELESQGRAVKESETRVLKYATRLTKTKRLLQDSNESESRVKSELEVAKATLEAAERRASIWKSKLETTSETASCVESELEKAKEELSDAEHKNSVLESKLETTTKKMEECQARFELLEGRLAKMENSFQTSNETVNRLAQAWEEEGKTDALAVARLRNKKMLSLLEQTDKALEQKEHELTRLEEYLTIELADTKSKLVAMELRAEHFESQLEITKQTTAQNQEKLSALEEDTALARAGRKTTSRFANSDNTSERRDYARKLHPALEMYRKKYKAFTTTEELYAAVDAYLGDDAAKLVSVRFDYGDIIGYWDVSQISNFSKVFYVRRNPNSKHFNEDLSCWDVSSARDMSFMFYGAAKFNSDLSSWDVSGVRNMACMFADASSFNPNGGLSSWHVSNCRDMQAMFCNATSFRQDLSAWSPTRNALMSNMFLGANEFDLSKSPVKKGWLPSATRYGS